MRPPSVFVRPLQHEEAVRLKRLSPRAKHESTRQRASVLLASNVRMSVPRIAEMWRTDPSWVRKVIHEFNERGMDSLRPRYRGGRPRRITTDQRKRIVSVAGARPDAQGIPLTRWSLPRRSAHLAGEAIEVSPRHLDTLLAGDPRVRGREQDRARPDPDLRQLPEPGRVPLLGAHRVRRLQRRLPRLGGIRIRARPPRPLPKRRASRPAHRRRRSTTPHRRLMALRVQPNFKGH